MDLRNKRYQNFNESQPIEYNNFLIMIISPSEDYRRALSSSIDSFGFQIGGPFVNVEESYLFLRQTPPDLIIFDSITMQSELIAFSQIMQSEGKHFPILVLHKEESFSIFHPKIDYLYVPINNTILLEKITNLMLHNAKSKAEQKYTLIKFVNKIFSKIVELTPISHKINIEIILNEALVSFASQNTGFILKNEESLELVSDGSELFDESRFKIGFTQLIDVTISRMDQFQDTEWSMSLVHDSVENILLSMEYIPSILSSVVANIGIDVNNIRKSLVSAVSGKISMQQSIVVAKLVLSDKGPELHTIISRDENLIGYFDDNIASQIITLVGQGSSYHQGIFGPIPIPRSEDLIAVIWSKLMNAEIKDERMEGQTLVVVAIALKRDFINLIPTRDKLEEIFKPLENLTHEREITKPVLEDIIYWYQNYLI